MLMKFSERAATRALLLHFYLCCVRSVRMVREQGSSKTQVSDSTRKLSAFAPFMLGTGSKAPERDVLSFRNKAPTA